MKHRWRPLHRSVLVLALILSCLAGCTPSLPTQVAATAGSLSSGDSLFPTIGNGGYDVQHYQLDLAYQTGGTIAATTTITAQAATALSSFSLDLEGLTVTSVSVNGQPASWSRSATKLLIIPGTSTEGTFTVKIDYQGKPTTHIDPDGAQDGWIPTSGGATVLSEPVGAMTWFPNNNTPRDKATFDIAVTVPKPLAVAGNGDLESHTTSGSTSVWRWHQSLPMATYLAMISIGSYRVYHSTMTTLAGKQLPLWSFIDTKLGSLAAQRAQLPQIIRGLERRYGPYPQSSAGIVVKKSDVGYSLETQNRPVFDSEPDTELMVHELSHQWFGDSLTPGDWGDIWLNEGFATLTEWLWTGDHGGTKASTTYRKLLKRHGASSSFWTPATASLKSAKNLFSENAVYDRGAMTLWALHRRVTGPTFWKIVQSWTTGRQRSTVSSPEFIALASQTAGKDLSGFFTAWLHSTARPATSYR